MIDTFTTWNNFALGCTWYKSAAFFAAKTTWFGGHIGWCYSLSCWPCSARMSRQRQNPASSTCSLQRHTSTTRKTIDSPSISHWLSIDSLLFAIDYPLQQLSISNHELTLHQPLYQQKLATKSWNKAVRSECCLAQHSVVRQLRSR